ncbi:MAG TPA: hypothetical protein VF875_18515 [Anaeromyxobacter sp.]
MARASRERALVAAYLAGALLAVAGARAEEAAVPGGGGAIRIGAEPARLELGKDDGCELRIAALPDVEELTFTASAGRVEAVRRLPGGGFVARFRAPAEHVPRVAIVAALGRGSRGLEDGWLAIPMAGRGTARVRGAPGTAVTLRVGDRLFGPAVIDASGVAAIPVVVPPGIREAHHGFRPIDLPVPETPLVHAVADRAVVRADREEKVRILAYVVAPHGAARRGDAPALEPSRGTVAVAEREPGAWSGTWTLPPGPAGEDRLAVRLPSSAASPAVLRVTALVGPPATVAISFDRPGLVAGGEPATVTARALDGGGNQVAATLALDAAAADLSEVRVVRPGEVVARVAAGERLRGEEAVVSAAAPELGISGARALPLRPDAPASSRFAPQVLVRGDGRTEVALHVAIADRFGNPAAVAPEVTAERGRVVGVARRSPGDFEVRYLPPVVDEPAREVLRARAGAAVATLEPLVAPPSPAFRLEAGAGAGGELGGRFAAGVATFAVERPADLAAALRVGLEPALRVEAGLVATSEATLGAALAGASVRHLVSGTATLSASAALGVAFGAGSLSPAARAAAALAVRAGPLEPFVELSVLGVRAPAPGAFAAAALSLGVRIELEDLHDRHPDRR